MFQAKDASAILYISYGTAAVTQLYIFCAGGTYIEKAVKFYKYFRKVKNEFYSIFVSFQSNDINKAAYFTDWYKLDVRNQRLIQFVILRSQHPCNITVPFFQSSLVSFTTVIYFILSLVVGKTNIFEYQISDYKSSWIVHSSVQDIFISH